MNFVVKHRIAITIITTLFFILLLGFLRPFSFYSGIPIERFWASKISWQGDFDIVAAGDSQVIKGISPAAMKEILSDKRIANYSFLGCGFTAEYLDSIPGVLDVNSRYRLIILGLSPRSLTEDAANRNHFVVWRDIKRENPGYIRNKFIQYVSDFFRRYTPEEAANFIMLRHEGAYNVCHEDGWMSGYRIPEDHKRSLEVYKRFYSENQVKPRMIRRVVGRVSWWKKRGIITVGYRPTSMKEMAELENQLGGYNEKDIRERFIRAGGIWMDYPIGEYHTYDGLHPRDDQAVKFSKHLAQFINGIYHKHENR